MESTFHFNDFVEVFFFFFSKHIDQTIEVSIPANAEGLFENWGKSQVLKWGSDVTFARNSQYFDFENGLYLSLINTFY